MKNRNVLISAPLFSALLAAGPLMAKAATPASPPNQSTPQNAIAKTSAPDQSTPQKVMAAMYNAAEAEDRAALRALIAANTKSGTAFADDFAILMTTNHRFHRILSKKLPDYKPFFWEMGTDKELKAQRDQTAQQVFKIDGNRATMSSEGGTVQMEFVLTGKSWQLDFDRAPGFDAYPLNGNNGDTPAMMYLLTRYSPALDAVAADVDAGKITTTEQAKAAMEKLTAPIQQQVEKELADLQAKQKSG